MALNQRQLEEAKKYAKEAASASRRTLTRWTPDWDTAGANFEKAATLYKTLKMYDESVDCFIKAGDAFYKCDIVYNAGKNYESAGNVRRDEKKLAEAANFFERAGQFFLEDGKPDRACEVLLKAAKTLEANVKKDIIFKDSPEITAVRKFYQKLIDVWQNEKKYHMLPDSLIAYNAFLLKQKLYLEAIDNMKIQVETYQALKQNHNVYKAYLSITIVHLANGDFASADDANNDFSNDTGYNNSEEASIATSLLSAFEQFNSETLETVKKESKLKFLEPQVFTLAKNLKIGGIDKNAVKRAAPKQGASDLASKKAALLGGDDMAEFADDDGCDENGVPIDDLTGGPSKQQPSSSNEIDLTGDDKQVHEEEHGDVFDDTDLT